MKKSSFYWNWLARVAKANNTQRKVVVKSATPTKSPISGKTAILVVAAIIVVALTTQTTGPTAQSTDIPDLPDLPDLPDPGPVPEPSFPPIPPGTLTCQEYLDAIMPGIKNSHSNWQKAIENAYNAKSKPFNDAKNAAEDKIGEIGIKIARLWSKRNFLNRHDPAYLSKSRQILKEIRALRSENRVDSLPC